jgi:hypothetical protein
MMFQSEIGVWLRLGHPYRNGADHGPCWLAARWHGVDGGGGQCPNVDHLRDRRLVSIIRSGFALISHFREHIVQQGFPGDGYPHEDGVWCLPNVEEAQVTHLMSDELQAPKAENFTWDEADAGTELPAIVGSRLKGKKHRNTTGKHATEPLPDAPTDGVFSTNQ